MADQYDEMSKRLLPILIAFQCLAAALPADAEEPSSSSRGIVEMRCDLNGDSEEDLVRIYHTLKKNSVHAFQSVAIFAIRQQESIVPIYQIAYESKDSEMLWVKPTDVDGDGLSEFILGESDVRWSQDHTYTRVSLLELRLTKDDQVRVERLFQTMFNEAVEPSSVQVKSTGPRGSYRLSVGKWTLEFVEKRPVSDSRSK